MVGTLQMCNGVQGFSERLRSRVHAWCQAVSKSLNAEKKHTPAHALHCDRAALDYKHHAAADLALMLLPKRSTLVWGELHKVALHPLQLDMECRMHERQP
jgi:hypothetical protein